MKSPDLRHEGPVLLRPIKGLDAPCPLNISTTALLSGALETRKPKVMRVKKLLLLASGPWPQIAASTEVTLCSRRGSPLPLTSSLTTMSRPQNAHGPLQAHKGLQAQATGVWWEDSGYGPSLLPRDQVNRHSASWEHVV